MTDRPAFADHFSAQAAEYARFRPDYPPALFAWLAELVSDRRAAWDCATGNGQAAVALAEHFDTVIATDASAAQIASAPRHPRVRYAVATAENCGLDDASVSMVTVAQALHWLKLDEFYAEVRRVVAPGGAIAVWSYGLTSITPELDEVIEELYRGLLGSWWPFERVHVENGYRDLPFPFEPIEPIELSFGRDWSLDDLLGYIGTWSAVNRYRKANGEGELGSFAERIAERWGSAARREVRWPLTMRVGRVRRTP